MADMTPQPDLPAEVAEEIHNPWREFIENVIDGSNYFRASEYRQLLDDLDRGYRAEAHIASLERQLAEADEHRAHTNWLVGANQQRIAELEAAYVAYRDRAESAEHQLAEVTARAEGLADRWERIGEAHGVRTFTGNDHMLFANELRAAAPAHQGQGERGEGK